MFIFFHSTTYPARNAKTYCGWNNSPGSWLLVTKYIGRLACRRIARVYDTLDLSSCTISETYFYPALHVAIDSVVRGHFNSYAWGLLFPIDDSVAKFSNSIDYKGARLCRAQGRTDFISSDCSWYRLVHAQNSNYFMCKCRDLQSVIVGVYFGLYCRDAII